MVGGFQQSIQAQKKVWEKFGDESMEVHDAYSASKFYEKALAADTGDVEVKYKLAKASMAYQNYEKALPYIGEISELKNATDFPTIKYDLGKIFKHLGCFPCSEKYFKKYLQHADKSSEEYLLAKNEIANFPKVKELIEDTLDVKVTNLSGNVNTGAAEFASIVLNDSTLLFSSLRATSVLEDGTIKSNEYRAGIFKAKREDSSWVVQEKIKAVNSGETAFVNGSFNKDKTEIYYTVCKEFGDCKIYKAKYNNDEISEVEELPVVINALESNTTHPQLVEIQNKRYLLFSSNRVGGVGGMDLWCSTWKNGWRTPKNLGKSVNSKGHEITPFMDVDSNKLYFSSDWHYNIGGFDIFSVEGNFPSKWSDPVNMGIPYNSPLNDLYFTMQDSSSAFLTSSREGSITDKDAACCNDIYEIKIPVKKSLIAPVDDLLVQRLSSTMYQLPVTVYFHNDRPNKDSWDTLTSLNYEKTYLDYIPLFDEYKKEFSSQFKDEQAISAVNAVDTFFNNRVYEGRRQLLVFSVKLLDELSRGKSIEVLMKGFASPLTKSNYNVNLSLRRISSLRNFLERYDNGKLLPFINGTARNGARLTFVKNPNGEYNSREGVSDD